MERKLAVFGLCFALAELAAAILPPPAVWLVAALLVAAGLLAVLRRRALRRWWPVAAGALLGLAWWAMFNTAAVRPAQALAGQTVTAAATVEPGCTAAYQQGMLRGTLRLQGLPGIRGSVQVRCDSFPGQRAGERFTAQFALAALPDDAYRLGRYADGIYLQAEYLGDHSARPDQNGIRFWLDGLRRSLSLRLRTWLPRSYGAVEAAMLLGDRSLLPTATTRLFQLAGVAHLLAVSGLHVALLCGLLRPGGRDPAHRFSRPALLLQALLLLFYMALTGFPVSVVRAGLAFLLALAGDWLLQPPDLLTSMGAAALVLSLQNAYAPCDVGFQLSFCAVLGVQAAGSLARWQRRALARRDPEEGPGALAGLLLNLAEAAEVAAFASLATMPVLIAHGMTVSGVAVLTNLLVVWMLRPALLLGLLVLALTALPVLAPCLHAASLLLAVWLRAMLGIIQWCAALPMARLCLPRRYTLWVLAVLGVLAAVFWRRRRRTPMLWYLPAAAACTALAVALGVVLSRDVVTVALVGTTGNPCAVVTQNGRTAVLFRGGAANLEDVQDYLAARGAPGPALLVDIRQQPRTLETDAGQTLVLAQQADAYRAVPFSADVTLHLYHRSGGNLAVVQAGQSRIAIMAGNIALAEPAQVDVYCAGAAQSHSVAAATVLTNSAKLDWLPQAAQDSVLLYGSGTPSVVIRPGRSIIYEEVKHLAVQ